MYTYFEQDSNACDLQHTEPYVCTCTLANKAAHGDTCKSKHGKAVLGLIKGTHSLQCTQTLNHDGLVCEAGHIVSLSIAVSIL